MARTAIDRVEKEEKPKIDISGIGKASVSS